MNQYQEAEFLQQRQQKQAFLKQEIIEKGYDGGQFGEYLNSVKPNGGANIDVWSFNELKELVYKFKSLALQQPNPVVDNNVPNTTLNSFDNPFDNIHNESTVITDSTYHMQRDMNTTQTNAPKVPNLRGERTGHETAPKPQYGFGSIPMEESKFTTASANVPHEDEKRPRIESQDIRADQEEVFSDVLNVKITEATQLTTTRNAEVIIMGYEQVKEGLFSAKYIQYQIKTVPVGWEVKRRFSDFVWLRNTLIKLHPGVMIPPIPKKTKNYKPGFLRRRVYFFQRFLNAIMLNDELRTDKYYFAFLSVSNDSLWKAQIKEADKRPRIGKLADITTISGQAPLEINKDLKFFAAGFSELCGGVDPIYEKIKKFSRQLISDFEQVSNTLYTLADCYAHLNGIANTFNKRTNIGKNIQLENIYMIMNNMMATWAEQTQAQSEAIQKYVIHFYKYTEYENDVFKEVLDHRTKYGLDYISKKKDVNLKKDKLFAGRDFSKWGVQDLKGASKEEILNNKQLAFDVMLPKETAALGEVQQTFAFYNAMCFKELDHALQERCRQYAKNFMEFGKVEADIMGQIQMKWHEQLSRIGETKISLGTTGAELKSKTTKGKVDESKVDFEDD